MRTFLAFNLKSPLAKDKYIDKINKVLKYYKSKYLEYELSFEEHIYKNIGSFIIDDKNSYLNFPTKLEFNSKKILTFFPPISLSNELGLYAEEIDELCQEINKDKNKINELPSPFLFSEIDETKEELNIYPDMMGVNRLYKLENSNGVYWSNRPAALLIFANEVAKIDIKSWNIYASSGWFMNNLTPFEKIERVAPSVIFKAKCNDTSLYNTINTKGLEYLLDLKNIKNISVSDVTNDMMTNLKNYQKLWNVDMQVDISGGQDSRVSAAVAINSGIKNFSYRSISDIDAEVNTAKRLLKIVDNNHKFHVINPQSNIENYPDLSERVDRLLFEFDGDFATVMMNSPIVQINKFKQIDKTLINGFGGEIAKGAFYTNQKWIDKLLREGDKAVFNRLSSHLTKLGCISEFAKESLKEQIHTILLEGENLEITGLKLLDYFYFQERIRRWSPMGDMIYSYTPFMSSKFISVGLNANPSDNMNAIFHKEIINSLMPEWESIPFFKATPEQSKEKDNKNLRIWQTSDKIQVEDILETPNTWNDSFVENEILDLWKKAKAEGIPNYQETLFQRVILRSYFNRHLNNINSWIEK